MPEYLMILIRSIVAFLVLLAMTRLMGKTQLAQLTFFDYVVGISVGSIAASMSVDQNVKILNGFMGILVWGLLPIVIAIVNLKSYRFRRMTDGQPTILVHRGNVLDRNLRKSRMSSDELMLMLRQKNAFKLADVEFAVLETNGQLSVMKKTGAQAVTPDKMGIRTKKEEHEPQAVIMDGNVMESTLTALGYEKSWLLKEIRRKGADGFEDVFMAQLSLDGTLHVDLKEK
ncbi:DUF421 domain-containing protein [Paenibacillus humicola]|uniref:DUF421 domain-containing protein n=1 Tax=Paenibacillus humicola TaxID=3110540 RepID=UPI00237BFE4B|nr:DUF421 domain-containing protein [Paenibacillus humicola]